MAASFADALNWVPKSRNLATTLARAFEYAKAQGHSAVTLEHLLLALVADPDASLVLQASNVDLARLNADASTYLAGFQDQRPVAAPSADPAPGDDLVRILDYASAAARQSRRREINGAIVLAAIVGDGRSPAASMLRAQGLTFEETIKALQRSGSAARAAGEPGSGSAGMSGGETPPASAPQGAPVQQPPVHPVTGGHPAPPPDQAPHVSAGPSEHGGPRQRPAGPASEQPGSVNGSGAHQSAPSTAEELLASARQRVESGRMAGPPPAGSSPSPAPRPNPLRTAAEQPPAARGPADHPRSEPVLDPLASSARPPGPAGSEPPLRAPDGPPSPSALWPNPPPQATQRPAPPPPPPGRPVLHHGEAPAPAPRGSDSPGPPPSLRGEAPGQTLRPPPVPRPQSNNPLGGQPPGGPQSQRRPQWNEPPSGPARSPHAEFEYDGYPAGAPYPHPDDAAGPHAPAPAPRAPRRPGMPPAAGPGQRRAVQLPPAQVSDTIPRRMRVGVSETVEVRIANADVLALADGLQGPGAAYRHEFVLTKALAVRLRAPEGGFWIEPLSPETVWIDSNARLVPDDYVSWRWTVTPQFRGRVPLQLIVSARTVGTDGLAAETALPDQTFEIRVRRNYRRAAARWAGWLAAAAVGAVLGRFSDVLIALGKSVF